MILVKSCKFISYMFLVAFSIAVSLIVLSGTARAQAEEQDANLLYSTINECAAVEENCSDYTVQEVSSNDFHDKLPKINDFGDVVWQGKPADTNYEIYLKTAGTANIEQITDNEFVDELPQINNSREITWMGHNGTDYDIYLYSNGSTTKLSTNPMDDLYPKINNLGDVVWLAVDGHDYEIYRYKDGSNTQITDNEVNDVQVRLNDSGDVMWRRKAEMSSDIFLLSGGTTTQINNDDLFDHHPQMNNNADLVWEVADGNDCEIIVKFASESVAMQITDNDTEDWFPMINASGVVVWQGHDGTDSEIFAYANGVITQITDNDINDMSPQINDAGDIAWLAMGADVGIYMYQASTQTISKISESYIGHYDSVPDINNQGKIVWSGWDGNDFEIVIASGPLTLHDDIHLSPQTVNLQSKGKGFSAAIDVSQPYSAADIDSASVAITKISPAGAASEPLVEPLFSTGKYMIEDDTDKMIIKFDRQALIELLEPLGVGIVDLKLAGNLNDGTPFVAVNSIKVVDRKASLLKKANAKVQKLKQANGKRLGTEKIRLAKESKKK